MSFKENAYQQMSFTDSLSGLTDREQNRWKNPGQRSLQMKYFLPLMKSVFLYYTDDEMVENLMLDFRIQYALHTTSFEGQPLSDTTLSRFCKRCYVYKTLHNKDLYHDCVKDLSASIAKLMGISGKVRRMDSMMIESNIRKLSRMELIYTCIAKLAIYMNKINDSALSDDLKHNIDPKNYNRVIYH